MKWNFSRGKDGEKNRKRVYFVHWLVNVGVVFSWLLAISDFPLTCWLKSEGPLSQGQGKSVSMVRLFLVAIIQALTALEVFYDEIFL